MTDYGNGTYSYSVTYNSAGEFPKWIFCIGTQEIYIYLQVSEQVLKNYYDSTTSKFFFAWLDNKINDIYPDPIHLQSGSWSFGNHTNIRGYLFFYLQAPTSSPIKFYKKLSIN